MYPINETLYGYFTNENRQVLRMTIGSADAVGASIAGVAVVGQTIVGNAPYIIVTESDIESGSFTIDRAIASSDSMGIGECIATELSFTLYNEDGKYNNFSFYGKEVYVEVGVTDDDGEVAGYIPMGYYYIDSVPKKRSRIAITALDKMILFDQLVDTNEYLAWAVNKTVDEYIGYAVSSVGAGTTNDTSDFPNASYVVPVPPQAEGMTYRNILQYCVGMMGANAYYDWQGKLIIEKPKRIVRNPNNAVVDLAIVGQSSTLYEAIVDINNESGVIAWDESDIAETISAEDRFEFEYEDGETSITGIQYIADNETYLFGGSGNVIDVSGNPMVQDVFHNCNEIMSGIVGIGYAPMSAETIPYPHLYPGDWVISTAGDTSGNRNRLHYLTNVTFRLNGHTKLQSAGKTPEQGTDSLISSGQYVRSETSRLEDKINELSDKIKAQNSNLSQKADVDGIIAAINTSGESGQINGTKLNINGTISANGNVKINMDGTIDIKNGTINSYDISKINIGATLSYVELGTF